MNSNQDIIANAQTGTGKTAAFGLPSIHLTRTEDKKTQTLILCPTRELCIQITNDLLNYSKYIKKINIVAVYGGTNIDSQIRSIKKGAQIIIGTPGRTKDLIRRKKLFVDQIDRIILDEADEMLSMGFKEDLESILSKTSQHKQILLFSATMSKKIILITKKYMSNPHFISAEKVNTGPKDVKHIYYMVQAKYRYEVLKRIADMNPNIYGITFCRTRRETKEIANKLMQDGYNADALHGDLSQAQRDEVMNRFRKERLQILVATDVAARGLDVNNITHIINYNLPDDEEVYIHRSGRTGRAGNKGISMAIIHTREIRKLKAIEKKCSISFSKQLVPNGVDICKKQLYSLIDKIENVKVDNNQIEPFLQDIFNKLEWLSREELIKHFVSAEFNRFLSYYKNAKDINELENRAKNKKAQKNKVNIKGRRHSSFSSIYINIGSNKNINPNRLMGIINEALDSNDAIIGKIQIMKKFSFFEIDPDNEKNIIEQLNGKKYKGEKLIVQISKEKKSLENKKDKKTNKFFNKGQKNDRNKYNKRKRRKHKKNVK